MYDPLVVDTFAGVKIDFPIQQSSEALNEQHGKTRSPGKEPGASTSVKKASRRFIDDDFARAGQTVLTSLQHATSATLAILYLRDYNSDEAFSAVISPSTSSLDSNVMALGSGVTGWVIANGRAMVNADAKLDFGSIVSAPHVSRCTAVPLTVDGEAVGALACYLDDQRGFGDREVAVMEKIASTFNTQPLQDLIRRVIAKFAEPL